MERIDELLTITEVSKRLKCNKNFVYELISAGVLPYLQFRSKKVRKIALDNFLEKYEGWDLSDPTNPRKIEEKEDQPCIE